MSNTNRTRRPQTCVSTARRFRVGLRLSAVAASALIAVAALPASASAVFPLGSKVATAKNANVFAQCGLTLKSVNLTNDTVTGTLGAQARPAGLAGYFNNVFTSVTCSVYDHDTLRLLAEFTASRNAATVSQNVTVTFARLSSYFVCADASVTLRNGNSSDTDFTCS